MTDWLGPLLQIVAIDLMLAGDNALVIALATRGLPAAQRKRAVVWGVGFAIIVRVAMTAGVASLLTIPGLMSLGGLVLIWIAWRFANPSDASVSVKPVSSDASLWTAVQAIVLADIAMGADNMLAVGGAARGDMVLLIAGLGLSIPIMLCGAGLIIKALERWPRLLIAGAAVLVLTAGQMIWSDPVWGRL